MTEHNDSIESTPKRPTTREFMICVRVELSSSSRPKSLRATTRFICYYTLRRQCTAAQSCLSCGRTIWTKLSRKLKNLTDTRFLAKQPAESFRSICFLFLDSKFLSPITWCALLSRCPHDGGNRSLAYLSYHSLSIYRGKSRLILHMKPCDLFSFLDSS